MNLTGYSDSEGSDDEALQAPQPASKAAPKPAFQKVVDRSQPGKIKLSLPAPSHGGQATDGIEADAPPAKRPRIGGGGLGGFNAMLPAPKKTATTAPATTSAASDQAEDAMSPGKRRIGKALGAGVNLKTGAEPAFKREPKLVEDEVDDTRTPMNNDAFRAKLNLPAAKTAATPAPSADAQSPAPDVAKDARKPARFMPMSVARGKKKKPVAAAPSPSAPAEANARPAEPAAESKPPPKPKVSLFGSSHEAPSAAGGGPSQPPTYEQEEEGEDDAADEAFETFGGEQAAPVFAYTGSAAPPPGPQNLSDIASELNLSEAERRQLLGRKGRGHGLASTNIVDFNIDREYAHNEQVRAQGETVQHNALKSISGTGKNSLRSLINVAVTQKDALEEHFAQGKRNKKEAGNKYGW